MIKVFMGRVSKHSGHYLSVT